MFDRYVMVDWSASSAPKRGRDSIWLHALGRASDEHDVTENPPTRRSAHERLRELVVASRDRHERVLVGFDFSLGYPSGFAAALGLRGPAWRAVWDYFASTITDSPTNANNRFEVAATINERLGHHTFWGCPPRAGNEHLSPKMDCVRYRTATSDNGLAEWRETELAITRDGRRPQSTWKLMGVGSVGSQSLVGIPVVAALRDDPALASISAVWPFEVDVPSTHAGTAAIVYAEVWPSMIAGSEIDPAKVRDAAQVEQLAAHFHRADETGTLTAMFAAAPPTCRAEEGWVLGA